MTRFTVIQAAPWAEIAGRVSWRARGLYLELVLAADFQTGMVPATSRDQVAKFTGRSWSATASQLDELLDAGLIDEGAAGIAIRGYEQLTGVRGNREPTHGNRESLAYSANPLTETARPTCENAGTTDKGIDNAAQIRSIREGLHRVV